MIMARIKVQGNNIRLTTLDKNISIACLVKDLCHPIARFR